MANSEAQDVLAMREEELLATVGQYLLADRMSLKPLSTTDLVRTASGWLAEKKAELVAAVCGNPKVRELAAKSSTDDREALVLLIGDLIVTIAGGIPVIYVSGLVVKQGVQGLCKECWQTPA